MKEGVPRTLLSDIFRLLLLLLFIGIEVLIKTVSFSHSSPPRRLPLAHAHLSQRRLLALTILTTTKEGKSPREEPQNL